MLLALAFLPVVAFGEGGTRTLSEFPAKLGEKDDTARDWSGPHWQKTRPIDELEAY